MLEEDAMRELGWELQQFGLNGRAVPGTYAKPILALLVGRQQVDVPTDYLMSPLVGLSYIAVHQPIRVLYLVKLILI